MKIKLSKLFMTGLTGLAVLSATSIASAAQDCKMTNVKFKKGAYSASYNGKVKGWQCVSYKFSAKQGQTLNVNLTTKGNAEAVLYDNYDFIQGQPYLLPKTGSYEVRVLQPKAAAIKNKTSSYNVNIEIR
ncbi:inhibitor of g-type lysozyme [[Pasteurella] aerogenes]|nr:inhibitor of g-type lysozyme [[Pasteurella] aerogenes]UWZ92646.1 inhibitor of g-type lysozyme [[Pasteurella] aerogenes]